MSLYYDLKVFKDVYQYYFSFMNKTKNELLSMDNLAYWPLFCQQIITELRGCDFFNRKWRIKEDEWPECPK